MSDETAYRRPPRDRTRLALIVILGLLVLLLAGMTYALLMVLTPLGAPGATGGTQTTKGLTWVRSIYGWGGTEAQQFRGPSDVAVAPDGTIWGTDPQRARVLGFNPDGTFKGMIMRGAAGAVGPGRLMRPEGVGTDDEGNVYIADYGGNKVAVYTPQNTLIREVEVPTPLDVVVTRDRMYVSAVSGVAVFTRDGKFLNLWGKRGNGPEEFDTARGIAVGDDGTVYVVDTNNARVKAYKPDGSLLWIWPSDRDTAKRPGATNKTKTVLQLPSGTTMDGRGRLVFVDPFQFAILILDPAGAEKSKISSAFGAQGSRDGAFTYPTGIAYDPGRDWFVVADTNNDRLQIVRLEGTAANPVLPAVARLFAGPWWLCAIPLALFLLAVTLVVLRQVAVRKQSELDSLDGSSGVPAGQAAGMHDERDAIIDEEGAEWYSPSATDDVTEVDS